MKVPYGGHAAHMLALLSIGLASIRLGRRLIPPLVPTIVADLSISTFQVGLAISLASAGFALLQFPSGLISDQLNRKTVILGSISVTLLGLTFLSVAASFYLFLLSMVITGIGEGMYGAADRGLLSDLFDEEKGVVFGIHTASSDIAGILSAVIATVVIGIGLWRMAFLPAIGGLLLTAIFLYFLGREPILIKFTRIDILSTTDRLLHDRQFLILLIAYSLFAIVAQGVIGFIPALLSTEHQFSTSLASFAFALMFVVGLIVRPVSGRISDKIDRLAVSALGLGIGTVGIILLVFMSSPTTIVVGVLVFAMGQKAFPPAMQAYLMDSFSNESMAGDLGVTRTIYLGIGSLGPVYVGFVADKTNYLVAFIGFAPIFLISGLLISYLLIENRQTSTNC